ncbi:hypothetical protein Sros01_29670 [Streptomyces roseochromogenus]|nr:hypothetical protein Sros01_29670 [Streptomyces roseochromogenus]
MLTLPTFFRVSLMALPEPTSREIREAEEVAMRADVYRTAVSLVQSSRLQVDAEPEDILRLARYLLREES